MKRAALAVVLAACGAPAHPPAAPAPPGPPATPVPPPPPATPTSDELPTSAGPLRIVPVHHATVLFQHAGKVFIVDPWSQGSLADLPKADAILLTDVHQDHFDAAGIDAVRKDDTIIVAPPAVASQLYRVTQLRNGESQDILGVRVEAVPMYNLARGPNAKERWHEKGRGNGYLLTFADKRVYVSGDTECTPEMRALRDIDVAFVCMNLPYTMPAAEAAECVRAFKPKIVYPYHFQGQDPAELGADVGAGIEVRLRKWY